MPAQILWSYQDSENIQSGTRTAVRIRRWSGQCCVYQAVSSLPSQTSRGTALDEMRRSQEISEGPYGITVKQPMLMLYSCDGSPIHRPVTSKV